MRAPPPRSDRRDAALRFAAFAFLVLSLWGAVVVSFAVTPEDVESGRFVLSPTCTFKRLTGHGCLGCGLTRGFAALSHGRFRDALRYNALTPVFYVGFAVGGMLSLSALVRAGRDYRRSQQPAR